MSHTNQSERRNHGPTDFLLVLFFLSESFMTEVKLVQCTQEYCGDSLPDVLLDLLYGYCLLLLYGLHPKEQQMCTAKWISELLAD